jgi:hypothetical protein
MNVLSPSLSLSLSHMNISIFNYRADYPTREWCDELMRACEERMIADKLYPCGKIYWLLPTFKERK